MEFNLVDILIVVALFGYVLFHMRDGVLALTKNLAGFLGGVILAFLTYHMLSTSLAKYIAMPPGLTDALSFFVLFIIFQILIQKLVGFIFDRFPFEPRDSRASRFLAIIPALIDGLILISLVLLLLVVAPFLPQVKSPIENSKIGGVLVSQASGIEGYIDRIFGRAAQESLGFLTIKPDADESVSLPYSPRVLAVDEEAEEAMLKLVNEERAKVGAKPLVIDPTIVLVAREHSKDMWQRQYFAHINPDGESPFDRMEEGEVRFLSAGENLALARTVARAHEGLMNSPGHKRNILDPSFGRIGIGVIDGGIYGKMFTQNFAN